ncbi:hypothetical protein UlMin_036463 [Ulmus minor]
MAKTQSLKLVVILVSSLILNLFFILRSYEIGGDRKVLSWSRRAAEEAEKVAAISCSGHGRAYLDGVVLNQSQPVCECNTCYGGPDCSEINQTDCVADAEGGNPLFLEPFWMEKAASSAVLVSGWHRMGYSYSDNTYISKELENHIRQLHKTVGNAITQGRYIVFGVGSTQLLNAAVHALSSDNSSSPSRVVATSPYYQLYKSQTELFSSTKYKFEGDTSLWRNNSDTGTKLIEFVTSPNNPDGQLNKAVLHGPNVKAIHDRVYYWPYFTPIPGPADEDIMVFSISKLTGHAGSRFGWAIVKDEAVFQRMIEYVQTNSMGVSREPQLRALQLVKLVLKSRGKEVFDFGYKTMGDRWEKLSNTFSRSRRFSLQKIDIQHCSYYDKIRGSTPAYAWVKCEREEDEDCSAVLKAAKIIGRGGSAFDAKDRFVRLSLIKTQDDFDQLLHRLNKLVSEEESIKPTDMM